MSKSVVVNCPHCGAAVSVNCDYTGGGSTSQGLCHGCGRMVTVSYNNDSFGFRINYVR